MNPQLNLTKLPPGGAVKRTMESEAMFDEPPRASRSNLLVVMASICGRLGIVHIGGGWRSRHF